MIKFYKPYKFYIISFSRLLLSMLFIFSGYVKSVDYMGTSIKIEEYLYAFGLDFLTNYADYFSILLCASEFLLGVMLLTKIRPKFTSIITLIYISFFLLITAYIFIADPVSDCGCFGDAIKLSNRATFLKNVIFFIIAFYLYLDNKNNNTEFEKSEKTALNLAVLLSLFIPLYSYFFVTNFDFLPYHIGVSLREATSIPENAPTDKYETKLIYKNIKTGENKTFLISDTTWQNNELWCFVESKQELISKGFTPEIKSFDITDKYGNIVTDSLLNKHGYTLFIIDNNMKQLSKKNYQQLNKIDNLFDCVILTTADISTSKMLVENKYDFNTDIYNLDETTLKSFLRSDKGVVLIKDGVILGKRNFNDIFNLENGDDIEKEVIKENRIRKTIYYTVLLIWLFYIFLYASKKEEDE
ncbi:MAG: DoxX family protein [Bacteroidetes bacterium]|nr:DoxX family protein [Bacteroidota bacterium]